MKTLAIVMLMLLSVALVPPRGGGIATAHPADGHSAAEPESDGSVVAADRERIQRHLEAVERHLRSADVSHLDAAQRARRGTAIEHLRAYRERGVFPHNHAFPERTPFFVDHRGVHCAMAYLIARSGAEGAKELVARVAATANNAYVRDLAADPALREWLRRHGMTVAEAALVQPQYGGWPQIPEESNSGLLADARERYGAVGTITLAADALALYLVTRGDEVGLPVGVAGVLAGTAGAFLGGYVLAEGSDRPRELLAFANLAAGVATVGLSVSSLIGSRGADDAAAPVSEAARLELTPALLRGGGLRPGVALALRF